MNAHKPRISATERERSRFWRFLSPCDSQTIMVAFKGIWTKDFWRAVSGEYLATLFFVLLGLGSTVNWAGVDQEKPPPADLVLISLCFGLGIATMVQCFGHISGAHVNPAVTVAMLVARKLSLAKALFYVVAQCVGAVTGAALLYLVTPAAVGGGLGVTTVNAKISVGHALVVELLITFQLVFTVFATCDVKRTDLGGSAGLAIGFAVTVGHLFAIPYTGASMNPARSLGPALVTLNFQNHWVYWVGPFLGGVLAAAMYQYLYCPDPDVKKTLLLGAFHNVQGTYKEVDGGGAYADDPTASLAAKRREATEQRDGDEKKEEEEEPFSDPAGEARSSV